MIKIKALIKKSIVFTMHLIFNANLDDVEKNKKKFRKQVMHYKRLIKLFPFIKFEFAFNKIIENIIGMKADSTMINRANSIIMKQFDDGDDDIRMAVFKLLYFTQLLTEDNCRVIMDYALHTDNMAYRYWIAQDISRFTFRLQSGFYSNYYIDRKKIIEKIAEESKFIIPRLASSDRKKTLCLISSMLDKSLTNSTQRVVKMIVDGLSEYYDEILILTLDVFSPSKKEMQNFSTALPRGGSAENSKQIEEFFDSKKIKIHYSVGNTYKDRMQDSLNTIYSYNPKTILDMSDEYSIISYHYSKDFYTVYLPMRGGGSSLFYTRYLSSKWKTEISNRKFNSIDIDKIEEWAFPEYVPNTNGEYSRMDYKVNENDFVLVTVGNNSGSCTNDFIDAIIQVLQDHKDIVWILVGEKGPTYLHLNYQSFIDNHQIIEWGYEKNLSALYKMCNVLLRPNMTGGSGATAIAAMNKIPISMTNFICDPSRWLGPMYSSSETYEQLMEDVMHMYYDKEYYLLRSETCYDLVMKAADGREAWKTLFSILNKRIEE